jgi:hypothetical protein
MSDYNEEFMPAIERLTSEIGRRDVETSEMKRMVNKLCGFAGLPLRYPDPGPESGGGGHHDALKADQFYGKPLATAVREYLEMRGAPSAGGRGAATVKDIFSALKAGGFAFDTKNDDNALRGLRISLAKNSVTFHKLPNGQFGLLSWYPSAKPPKPATEIDWDAAEAEGEAVERERRAKRETATSKKKEAAAS